MLIGQGTLGIIFIAAGAILQDKRFYDDPVKLKNVSRFYLIGTILPLITTILSHTDSWKYFLTPIKNNFSNAILLNVKEFSLSIVFIDKDIMIFISLLLYVISTFYLVSTFGLSTLIGKYKLIDENGQEITKTNMSQVVASIVTIVLFVGFVFLTPVFVHINKVQMPYSANELLKIKYPEAKNIIDDIILKENIIVYADSKTLLDKEDTIKSISINDNEAFEKNTWIDKNSSVVIHVVKEYNKFPSQDLIIINDEKTYELPIDGDNINWTIEDESIASIDNGKVIGKNEGQTKVFVTIDGVIYTLNLSVTEKTTLEKISNTFLNEAKDVVDSISKGIENIDDSTKDFSGSISSTTGDIINRIKNFADKTGRSLSDFINGLND